MKYTSRKLIITIYTMLIALCLAFLNISSPETTNILLAAITSYTVSNAWSSKKGNDKDGYASRKFIITFGAVTISAISVYIGIMTTGLSNVVLAAITSYNLTNAWVGNDNAE